MRGYVLVGGWPGAGKTTLMDVLGAPTDVEGSRRLGRAAVHAVLAAARGCPGAVVDSTWYPYAGAPPPRRPPLTGRALG